MKKGIRSRMPEWRWGRDNSSHICCPGSPGSGVGLGVGSWLGRTQLDSSLAVRHLGTGGAGALCFIIFSLSVLFCVLRAVA